VFVEAHVIQNFALSNLNRDDTGAPKTCEFGGTRRARISSQCLKRAIRTYFRTEGVIPSEQLSYRTKRLKGALMERIVARGVAADLAGALAEAVIGQLGLKLKNEKTEYLLLVGDREIEHLASLALEHQAALMSEKKSGKGDKALQNQFLAALDGGEAVDLALFGRMIADQPDKNVDAAVQMAHAISTHAVATEFDFYSAVDDLQKDEDEEGAGAGMLGTTLYNSACYYRYANVDVNQLAVNLGNKQDLVDTAVEAFLWGMVNAVPTGKQTATAAQNPPALVMVTVRERGLWSLANAFVPPVRPKADEDLILISAEAMLKHYQQLQTMYAVDGIRYAGLATYLEPRNVPAGVATHKSVSALIGEAMNALAAARR